MTSSKNTQTFQAGYYDTFTVSTNITSLPGTIAYTHHQCSTTQSGLTYVDDEFDAVVGEGHAASVANLTTVNEQTVSTVKGGCYTTPYYYYSYTYTYKEKTGTEQECDKSWNGANTSCNGTVNEYGDTCYGGWTYSNCRTVDVYETKTGTAYAYGTSTSGTNPKILATYYLKSCGMTNGQLLSATITY